jgi:hypothetical protein
MVQQIIFGPAAAQVVNITVQHPPVVEEAEQVESPMAIIDQVWAEQAIIMVKTAAQIQILVMNLLEQAAESIQAAEVLEELIQ